MKTGHQHSNYVHFTEYGAFLLDHYLCKQSTQKYVIPQTKGIFLVTTYHRQQCKVSMAAWWCQYLLQWECHQHSSTSCPVVHLHPESDLEYCLLCWKVWYGQIESNIVNLFAAFFALSGPPPSTSLLMVGGAFYGYQFETYALSKVSHSQFQQFVLLSYFEMILDSELPSSLQFQ